VNLAAFGLERLGPGEIILVVVVVVLLFGAKRIPELARSLGKSISEFKKGQQEGASSDAPDAESKDRPDAKPPLA
jgi:sec-independent protein translocase protein TatA